jgi:hypothetical protein
MIVAYSMVESEYAAMAYVVKELIWLQQLFKDLGISKYNFMIFFGNNQRAISLAKNPTHTKTKYINVQLHFISKHIRKGTITIKYFETDNMLTDIMIKELACERHVQFLELKEVGTCEVIENTTPFSCKVGINKKLDSITAISGSNEL